MNIRIEPANLSGSTVSPPSKSAAHRVLIAAALAAMAAAPGAVVFKHRHDQNGNPLAWRRPPS